jgi:hypothetical protein
LILITGWRPSDDAYRTARMNKGVVGPADFDKRHDLRAGEYVVRLVRHCSHKDNGNQTRNASRENAKSN